MAGGPEPVAELDVVEDARTATEQQAQEREGLRGDQDGLTGTAKLVRRVVEGEDVEVDAHARDAVNSPQSTVGRKANEITLPESSANPSPAAHADIHAKVPGHLKPAGEPSRHRHRRTP
jgi:hypothetical protein